MFLLKNSNSLFLSKESLLTFNLTVNGLIIVFHSLANKDYSQQLIGLNEH